MRRPQRADARRNFDALIAAARDVFAENGTDASLEDIARRAKVGIGTLYRNFPTRQDLFTSVYVGGVEELCQARELYAMEPWDGFAAWLERFTDYVATKMAMKEALNKDSRDVQRLPRRDVRRQPAALHPRAAGRRDPRGRRASTTSCGWSPASSPPATSTTSSATACWRSRSTGCARKK